MRAVHFWFGYRELRVSEEARSVFISSLLKLGICAKLGSDGSVLLSEADYKLLKRKGADIEYTFSEEKGFFSVIKGVFKHKGALLGFCIALLINIFLSLFVWDIRIEGNDRISDGAIKEKLSEAGLEVGRVWNKLNKNEIEAAVLANNEEIAWLTVNRRGTVAYVKLVESESRNDGQISNGYGNIVAKEDCIIEQIIVERGNAMVKEGDIVRAGDVLISSVTDTPGGTLIEEAKGQILGKSMREISIFLPREDKVGFIERGKKDALSIKVFNFNLNIFKKYRNYSDSYDIINSEKEFVLFGRYKLPFSVSYSYPVYRGSENTVYTDSQLVKIAKTRMNSALYTLFDEDDIISISSEGKFEADGYYLRSTVTYVSNVGEFKRIEIN